MYIHVHKKEFLLVFPWWQKYREISLMMYKLISRNIFTNISRNQLLLLEDFYFVSYITFDGTFLKLECLGRANSSFRIEFNTYIFSSIHFFRNLGQKCCKFLVYNYLYNVHVCKKSARGAEKTKKAVEAACEGCCLLLLLLLLLAFYLYKSSLVQQS